MKHVAGGIAGLVLGALVAVGLVHLNPWTGDRTPPASASATWKLGYSLPGAGVLTLTHGGRLPLATRPAGVADLWEEAIASSVLATLRLDDARDANPVWATRISVPSMQTNLVLNGVVVDDHWLVSKPGAGTLYVTAETNVWPAIKDTLLRVGVLGQPWSGPVAYSPTLFSAASPALRGATGRFAGLEGRAREAVEIGRYDATQGLGAVEGRLVLEFSGVGPFTTTSQAETTTNEAGD